MEWYGAGSRINFIVSLRLLWRYPSHFNCGSSESSVRWQALHGLRIVTKLKIKFHPLFAS
ncbi:hypothetical protein Fuma_06578 [Fuerstiella marisgermanici]|uniref:Uncharacterized protein n=1 Tax=Fuerstiella marisgermanici TaxID=1891926 RepID=A0A1P8WS70_9PLAN|nr:hypothetical protein Fuma_06578 [Fuerstiella marisgermanici]